MNIFVRQCVWSLCFASICLQRSFSSTEKRFLKDLPRCPQDYADVCIVGCALLGNSLGVFDTFYKYACAMGELVCHQGEFGHGAKVETKRHHFPMFFPGDSRLGTKYLTSFKTASVLSLRLTAATSQLSPSPKTHPHHFRTWPHPDIL